jgi:hypothetical protein
VHRRSERADASGFAADRGSTRVGPSRFQGDALAAPRLWPDSRPPAPPAARAARNDYLAPLATTGSDDATAHFDAPPSLERASLQSSLLQRLVRADRDAIATATNLQVPNAGRTGKADRARPERTARHCLIFALCSPLIEDRRIAATRGRSRAPLRIQLTRVFRVCCEDS